MFNHRNNRNDFTHSEFPFHAHRILITATPVSSEEKEALRYLDIPEQHKAMCYDFKDTENNRKMLSALTHSLNANTTPSESNQLANTCAKRGQELVLKNPLVAIEFLKQALPTLSEFAKVKILIHLSLAHQRLFCFYHQKRKLSLMKWNKEHASEYYVKAMQLLDLLTTPENHHTTDFLKAAAFYVQAELMNADGQTKEAIQHYQYAVKSLELAKATHVNFYYPKLKMQLAALLMKQTHPEENPLDLLRDLENGHYFISKQAQEYTAQADLMEMLGDCLNKKETKQESLEKFKISLLLCKNHFSEDSMRLDRLESKIDQQDERIIFDDIHDEAGINNCNLGVFRLVSSLFSKSTIKRTVSNELSSYGATGAEEPLMKNISSRNSSF